MPDIILRPAVDAETEVLVAILHDTLPSEPLCREMLSDKALSAYTACKNEQIVGAIVVRWGNESAIELLAVDAARRSQGLGQAIIAATLEEARRRLVKRMLVGTSTIPTEDRAFYFYQLCGFRMSHVRRDYFGFLDPPVVWRGVTLRDMIVLDYVIEGETHET